ncbi:protein of unknown function [Methylomagnum ishizawai]|uniref:YfiR family protein n=1 Tax=Methylomagnum ishizawai TaxID=1760988 RepID=A0A1Y6CWY3_9GAMM|nr:YfiR family protein [Methylomagnum ishizawai]SMF94750.1 protein of unknown function [Methylomagnum ishizawai]
MIAMVLVLITYPVSAGSDISSEYKVKAAILVNLAKFTEWPRGILADSAPLTICLVGEPIMAALLTEVSGKTIYNHEIKVLALIAAADHGFGSCQVLFMGLPASAQAETLLNKIMDRPILTVSDIPGFARQGGMIELVRKDDHLGFDINLGKARKAGLMLRAQLLALAKIIE